MTSRTTSRYRRRWAFAHGLGIAVLVGMACLAGNVISAAVDPAPGSGGFTEYEVKAAFLFRFLSFVEWPAEARPVNGEPLVIAVYGRDPFGDALDPELHRAALAGRTVEIQRVTDPDELEDCHVVFFGVRDAVEVGTVLSRLRAAPILTVGESELFSKQGGIVRFLEIDNRVRFQIEDKAARRAGLRISSKLLRLGVREDDRE